MQAKNFIMLSFLILFYLNSSILSSSIPKLLNKNRSTSKFNDENIEEILDNSHKLINMSTETKTSGKWSQKSSVVLDEDNESELLESLSNNDNENYNHKLKSEDVINLVQNSLNEANEAEYKSLKFEGEKEGSEDNMNELIGDNKTNLVEESIKLSNTMLNNNNDSVDTKNLEFSQLNNHEVNEMEDDEISTDVALERAGQDETNTALLENANKFIFNQSNDKTEAQEKLQKKDTLEDEETELTETKEKKIDINLGAKAEELANMIQSKSSEKTNSQIRASSSESSEVELEEYEGNNYNTQKI